MNSPSAEPSFRWCSQAGRAARAAKMGLTLDQLRTLKICPGHKPTAEQLAQVKGGTANANKPAWKSKPKK